ncbi:MAG: A/G-specific adenine glycosylase [Acidimicrobiia bacterium]|nr:A/G-specific adenine glycosylase [Acidimicrobiia bacterium]
MIGAEWEDERGREVTRGSTFVEAVQWWWDRSDRQLPWREIRDPWPILVSEVMTQQTQVARVIPKWQRFLDSFPTPTDAAAATSGDLVALWDGLGYNRRAVMLHRCANEIVQRHGGIVPDQLDALMALSGIGPYTARAVQAFAFEQDVAVVDTNVGRVLARIDGQTLAPKEAQLRADSLVPAGSGWMWNQALLDFGALVCTKRQPACATCPANEGCVWRGDGPDPAIGSAAVSGGQSRFEGSDRQGRGRLVSALRSGPVKRSDAADVMSWGDDQPRANRIIASLLADGLVVEFDSNLRLP